MIRTFFAGAFLALIALVAVGVLDVSFNDADVDLPTISVRN